jgi:DNA-binding transcriptional MocR family regulator
MADRLQSEGVVITPSDAFWAAAASPPEAARLSLGAFPTREAMDRALDRIADLLTQDAAFDLAIV